MKSYIFAIWLVIAALAPPFLVLAEEESSTEVAKKEDVKNIKGEERQLTLGMGVSQTLEFPFDIGPIYVTDPNLFDYRRIKEGDRDRKLMLIPKNSGTTDFTIHDAAGTPKMTYMIRVTREEMGQLVGQLQTLLGDIEGLKIQPLGGTIILDGEILLPKDMIRIIRVVDALKDRDPKKGKETPIRNLATISKVTMNILAEKMEREFNAPELTARVINNTIFLEGVADSNFDAERALEIAKTYLPEATVEKSKGDGVEVKYKTSGGVGGLPTIVDLMKVRQAPATPPSQVVKVTVNYVELNNEYEKSFNFEWKPLATDSSSVKFDSAAGEVSANLIATVTSLLPKLVTAKQHQHARVLKTQTLLVKDRSENPASVDSSKDIYTTITNEKGEKSLQPITIQNALKVKANTIAGSDSLELWLQVSLNSILGITDGNPIIGRNSMQTQIIVKNGDSVALGGYGIDDALAGYNREPTRSSGVPEGGSTTPLFNLTRSKGYRHDKQQYVIFVTPEILRTAGAGTEDITRKFRLNAGEQ